ncbi:MAG: hypothetical protein WDM91_00265 [Rhizomicrobium sp.]
MLAVTLALLVATPARCDDWIIGDAQAASPSGMHHLSEQPRPFAIRAQPLDTALDAFGAATGIQIFYGSTLTAKRTSPGVRGVFTPSRALQILLAGTNLAPMTTGPDAITLVFSPQASMFAAAPLANAPVLSLEALHVDAPPRDNFRLYATTVQYAILGVLQREDALKTRSYRADINVWLSPSGRVQHLDVQVSDGDSGVDTALLQLVRRVVVGRAPPFDLPQPVHVRISAERQL